VALQQIDAAGHVLSSARASATVASDNGRSPSRGEAQSAYLATAFVAGRARIAIDPRAIALRLLIAPQTPGNFDLLDAWLAPWPAPTAGFGAPSAR
jgi:hypothetical protein